MDNKQPKCVTCGKPINKDNVARHIFGDCEGMFFDGSEAVIPIDSEGSVRID